MSSDKKRFAIAITGASGSAYALRLIEFLVQAGHDLYIMISTAGQIVLRMEAGLDIPANTREAEVWFTKKYSAAKGQIRVFAKQEWTAPVASGSNPPDAMVICPCTAGTLASVASGLSQNLIERASDVMIKERRKLILLVRETPFSTLHLENMLKLSQAGVVIMPANPGFYNNPESIQDLVDFMVARILDHLDVDHQLQPPWGG